MSLRLGIIAEDQSDLEVLQALAARIGKKKFGVSHFLGRGCGMVRRKARPWCENLAAKGCRYIAIVHDRDRNDAEELRRVLTSLVPRAPLVETSVIIPTEEIEAWLLSDAAAISRVLNLHKPLRTVNHPEKVVSPKEYLASQIRRNSLKEKVYITGVHNRLIAKEMSIDSARTKCPSFREFHSFICRATAS